MGHTSAEVNAEYISMDNGGVRPSLLRRLGWSTAFLLSLAVVAILGVAGFVTFLWFANLDNYIWHDLMVTGLVTRAVTVSTLVLRFAVDVETGLAGAMLAAMILESISVRLQDAVKVSMMRANSPQLLDTLSLIPAMFTDGLSLALVSSSYTVLILLLVATATVLQFSSTLLLSDLRLGALPSMPYPNKPFYDFSYQVNGDSSAAYGSSAYPYPIQLRTSTWLRPPPAFPAFAEYGTAMPSQEGVDDTGVLLRAFLPFADAETRESIRNYTGTAFVLDSRVSCQRPKLTDLRLSRTLKADNIYVTHSEGKITGKLQPTFPDVDRLWTPGPVAFECGVLVRPGALTLCQISTMHPMYDSYSNNGGLRSEFWNLTQDMTLQAVESGSSMWSLPMIAIQPQIISADDIDTEIQDQEETGIWTNIITEQQTWSVSVCYSAWATADLDVEIHSEDSRTEPIIHWNDDGGYYTVPDVHAQMGEVRSADSDLSTRGVLRLNKKESWFPSEEHALLNGIQPFVQQFVDATNPMLMLCSTQPSCSALLPPGGRQKADFYSSYVYNVNRAWTGMFPTDLLLSSLFHQTLDTNNGTGSLARAMSSLITTLSSMAYYDQMPQFAQSSNATQISFTKVLFPQSKLGYCVVTGCLAVHMALICLITGSFGVYSKYTLLGNHWQSVAQLRGTETDKLLARTHSATDGEVKKVLAASGQDDISVAIRSSRYGDSARLRLIRRGTLEGGVE